MKCPTDDSVLVMTERSGIEIDYCPQCRGVWLDRGELDKLLERAGAAPAAPSREYEAPRREYREQTSYPKKRKRENWLSELFD